jgi:hypothetical protein
MKHKRSPLTESGSRPVWPIGPKTVLYTTHLEPWHRSYMSLYIVVPVEEQVVPTLVDEQARRSYYRPVYNSYRPWA